MIFFNGNGEKSNFSCKMANLISRKAINPLRPSVIGEIVWTRNRKKTGHSTWRHFETFIYFSNNAIQFCCKVAWLSPSWWVQCLRAIFYRWFPSHVEHMWDLVFSETYGQNANLIPYYTIYWSENCIHLQRPNGLLVFFPTCIERPLTANPLKWK